MESRTGRLRYVDESPGEAYTLWNDAADAAIPSGGSVRFGVLRLRRELVFSDFGGGAGFIWCDGCSERAGVSPGAPGARCRNRAASGRRGGEWVSCSDMDGTK